MTPDPRWLEILKASGWQTAAVTAACGIFLVLAKWGLLPPLAPWMVLAVTFGLLISGFLTLANLISALIKLMPIHHWIASRVNDHKSRKAVREYIPYMTPNERRIIGYLIAHNQKMFTAAQDGGHAATLLSRGVVAIALRHNQICDSADVPMAIPDKVWEVLIQHKDAFPITEDEKDGPHPWRVPWMAR